MCDVPPRSVTYLGFRAGVSRADLVGIVPAIVEGGTSASVPEIAPVG